MRTLFREIKNDAKFKVVALKLENTTVIDLIHYDIVLRAGNKLLKYHALIILCFEETS